MKQTLLFFLTCILLFSQNIFSQKAYPKREFRGAWVATVANIDWPESKNATPGEQIKELVDIFDKLEQAGINAVMFQVRTECDALYDSKIEPWSYWLTGKQGEAPKPYFDPLAFAVSEAHSRGMELHAWFNPYRAVKKVGDYEPAQNHVSVTHPDWILDFGNYKMLDPGNPEVKDYIASIIGDVVRRYDVDGIHFDDYFYPYSPKVSNQDSISFSKFKGDFTNMDDWRRFNINSMVAEVYDTINAVNPRVKFGISPFGIVQNKYAGTNGFDAYNILYCDPLTWIKEKTVDYVNPQLYWKIGHNAADYAKLLPWWGTVKGGRQLYIGLYSSRFASSRYDGRQDELGNQLRMERADKNVDGVVYFSSKSITNNFSSFADSLENNFYKYPALVPTMSWKDDVAPLAPANLQVNGDSTGIKLSWDEPETASDGESAYKYVIYKFNTDEEVNLNNPSKILFITKGNGKTFFKDRIPFGEQKSFTYVVSALDRMQNESEENPQVKFEPLKSSIK